MRRLALIVRDPDDSLTAFTGKVGKKRRSSAHGSRTTRQNYITDKIGFFLRPGIHTHRAWPQGQPP